jgi:hypothetical protein
MNYLRSQFVKDTNKLVQDYMASVPFDQLYSQNFKK